MEAAVQNQVSIVVDTSDLGQTSSVIKRSTRGDTHILHPRKSVEVTDEEKATGFADTLAEVFTPNNRFTNYNFIATIDQQAHEVRETHCLDVIRPY
jgi:hypothetical protein